MDSTTTPKLETPEPEVHKEAAVSQASGSFFPDARDFEIKDGAFAINNQPITNHNPITNNYTMSKTALLAQGYVRGPFLSTELVSSGQTSLPDILKNRAAPNAILNDAGRAEDPECYPGTREKVISNIEKWIDTYHLYTDHGRIRVPMLWLRGPAGAGKTAIMKTIMKRSAERNVHTVNFFFFRGDPTRNSAHRLVATILYQIYELYPAARQTIVTILSDQPLLLDASIQVQFDKLLSPLFSIIRESSPEGRPIVLLLDGLDECDIDENALRIQGQVLRALRKLVAPKDSPFIALVASRDEPYIEMAIKKLRSNTALIGLDNAYCPEIDILHFVTEKFREIKRLHPKPHRLPDNWPPEATIEAIVQRSSGQFIYAATVMRFLESPSAFPEFSLEQFEGIVPEGENSPFAELDSLYNHILNRAPDREVALDVLAAYMVIWTQKEYVRGLCGMSATVSFDILPEPLREIMCSAYQIPPLKEFLNVYNSNYTEARLESSLLHLAAVVRLEDDKLVFHHSYFVTFLLDRSKSHEFYIDLDAFNGKVVAAFWRSTRTFSTGNTPQLVALGFLQRMGRTTPDITHLLLTFQPSLEENYGLDFLYGVFLSYIRELYYPQDLKSYRHILQLWTRWVVFKGIPIDAPLGTCAKGLFERLILAPLGLRLTGLEYNSIPFYGFYACLAFIEKRAAELTMGPIPVCPNSPRRDEPITIEPPNNTYPA